MPFCHSCGSETSISDSFCRRCGTSTAPGGALGPGIRTQEDIYRQLPYRISLNRVLFMTVLSFGLYLFYWSYLTWKQYRAQTGHEAYPVWHALTLLVPIYQFFRFHFHVRSFEELMLTSGHTIYISAGTAVALLVITTILGWVSGFIGGFDTEVTLDEAVVVAVLSLISIGLLSVMLLALQDNLNRHWDRLSSENPNITLLSARIGIGEVVFAIIGVIAWGTTQDFSRNPLTTATPTAKIAS